MKNKNKNKRIALCALFAFFVSALLLGGDAFAESTYSVTDFGNDSDFFKCLAKNVVDDETATQIPVSAVQSLTELRCMSVFENPLNIKKVVGLDKLTNVRMITFAELNLLEQVDVSGSPKLETLIITGDSALSSVKFNNNPSLKGVYITETGLKSVDLSKVTTLETLVLINNDLSNIDVSNNTKLTSLLLYGNNITTVDITKNVALTDLLLDDNVLVKAGLEAMQLEKDGDYIASNSNNPEIFKAIVTASGLYGEEAEITTSGVKYIRGDVPNCVPDSAGCISTEEYNNLLIGEIVFDADIENYSDYIKLKFVDNPDVPRPDNMAIWGNRDYTKRNYLISIELVGEDTELIPDTSVGTPDTGFFTGNMNGETIALSVGAVMLGTGMLYTVVYLTKRGSHKKRFN